MAPTTGVIRGVAAGVGVLLADNPGPMTLDGTNSYLLAGSAGSVVIVDPGPDDERHLRLLAGDGRVELILLTHRHADHTAGARRLAELTGAPVRDSTPTTRPEPGRCRTASCWSSARSGSGCWRRPGTPAIRSRSTCSTTTVPERC